MRRVQCDRLSRQQLGFLLLNPTLYMFFLNCRCRSSLFMAASSSVATLTYKVLSTQQPAYLYNLISYHQPGRLLRSSSQSLLHERGTLYLLVSDLPLLSQHSVNT